MSQSPSPAKHFRAKGPHTLSGVISTQSAGGNVICGLDLKLTSSARRWLMALKCGPIADRAEVVWNPRLQTTAGTACIYTARIELNPRLREIGPHQIQRTLRHEVAHLVAHHRAGRRARDLQTHGPEWRHACAELGIPDEPAFHDLPFQRRPVARKYAYQCPNCELVVKRVRRFSRYTACYRCCKKHNGGVYHPRYQFQRVEMQLR